MQGCKHRVCVLEHLANLRSSWKSSSQQSATVWLQSLRTKGLLGSIQACYKQNTESEATKVSRLATCSHSEATSARLILAQTLLTRAKMLSLL